MSEAKGALFLVGFGPGSGDHLTFRAKKAIEGADVVVGYETYVELVMPLLKDKEIVSTGMTEEIDRATTAVEKAFAGKKVAVVSSGDVGIYGMAGLVFEVLKNKGWNSQTGIPVEVIPGITALSAVASLVGAPLTHDFASISLSDLLTPWEVIEKRVHAAGQGDFVIALYNPQSKRRNWQLPKTREILLQYREPSTPVAIVKGAYRESQRVVVTDLEHMCEHEVGMLTTILIGNTNSYHFDKFIVTPRGYKNKYDIGSGDLLYKGIDKPGVSLKRPADFDPEKFKK